MISRNYGLMVFHSSAEWVRLSVDSMPATSFPLTQGDGSRFHEVICRLNQHQEFTRLFPAAQQQAVPIVQMQDWSTVEFVRWVLLPLETACPRPGFGTTTSCSQTTGPVIEWVLLPLAKVEMCRLIVMKLLKSWIRWSLEIVKSFKFFEIVSLKFLKS